MIYLVLFLALRLIDVETPNAILITVLAWVVTG